MATTQEATDIQQVEIDSLDNILGVPGGENIILPTEDQKKPSIFSKEKVDFKFIDTPDPKVIVDETPEQKLAKEKAATEKATGATVLKTQAEKDAELAAKNITKAAEVEILRDVLEEIKPDIDDKTKIGRPTTDKNALVESTKKLIEKGLLVPFDDDKKIEDYTSKDFEELYEANINDREAKVREETPLQFFDSLPDEMKAAAKYIADGGKDMKGMFRILSEVEEAKDLDPKKEADQPVIVREYLRATRFGTEDDITEEIDSWKDRNELDKKAEKFKPKLDAMQEQRINQKLKAQDDMRKSQLEASKHYVHDVYETLKPAELSGLKLDKKTQGMLYSGLVQPNYPSISGKPTNLLGHLLEKYQYVEPNHGLIAEALWLLADPDAYKAKIKELGSTAQVEKTVRQLKIAENDKKSNSTTVVEKDEVKTRTLPRNDNFFKRA